MSSASSNNSSVKHALSSWKTTNSKHFLTVARAKNYETAPMQPEHPWLSALCGQKLRQVLQSPGSRWARLTGTATPASKTRYAFPHSHRFKSKTKSQDNWLANLYKCPTAIRSLMTATKFQTAVQVTCIKQQLREARIVFIEYNHF